MQIAHTQFGKSGSALCECAKMGWSVVESAGKTTMLGPGQVSKQMPQKTQKTSRNSRGKSGVISFKNTFYGAGTRKF